LTGNFKASIKYQNTYSYQTQALKRSTRDFIEVFPTGSNGKHFP
jgi:hypothetical protein